MPLLPIKSSALASHLRVKANMLAIAHKALHLLSSPPLVHFIPNTLASILSLTTAGTTFFHSIFSAQNISPQNLYMTYSLISLKSLLKCFCLSEKFLIILFETMKLSVTQHLLSLPCFNFPLQPSTLSRHLVHFVSLLFLSPLLDGSSTGQGCLFLAVSSVPEKVPGTKQTLSISE